MPIKITSWNVEHSARLIGTSPGAAGTERRHRVRGTVEEIDPDILCLIEGPRGEAAATSFSEDVLGGAWKPVFLPRADGDAGPRDGDYETRGSQWIWFLVRDSLHGRCRLQAPAVWRAFTGAGKWKVHYWGRHAPTDHRHYRHPQVLIVEPGSGVELEVIGVHMKSKINRNPIERDAQENIVGAYLEEALEARIKLATEARDVRRYIDARFGQSAAPAIVLAGDVNDGPGQDFFERNYLFFDLIGNLQGSIVNSERFFGHALFEYPADLRWTARFRDKISGLPASRNPLLLDHILLSRPLVSGVLPYGAAGHAGLVEHRAYERGNAGASEARRSSDHRPVSVVLTEVPRP